METIDASVMCLSVRQPGLAVVKRNTIRTGVGAMLVAVAFVLAYGSGFYVGYVEGWNEGFQGGKARYLRELLPSTKRDSS